jgi:RNA polymerase sigma-70 factor (ECF subfamily)
MESIENLDLAAHDTLYEKKEIEQMVIAALDSLPDDYREALVLREYGGLSYSDIAGIVGASVATVSVRIFRAKKKLRQILSPYLSDLLV